VVYYTFFERLLETIVLLGGGFLDREVLWLHLGLLGLGVCRGEIVENVCVLLLEAAATDVLLNCLDVAFYVLILEDVGFVLIDVWDYFGKVLYNFLVAALICRKYLGLFFLEILKVSIFFWFLKVGGRFIFFKLVKSFFKTQLAELRGAILELCHNLLSSSPRNIWVKVPHLAVESLIQDSMGQLRRFLVS
jgi:hypothetical protein